MKFEPNTCAAFIDILHPVFQKQSFKNEAKKNEHFNVKR